MLRVPQSYAMVAYRIILEATSTEAQERLCAHRARARVCVCVCVHIAHVGGWVGGCVSLCAQACVCVEVEAIVARPDSEVPSVDLTNDFMFVFRVQSHPTAGQVKQVRGNLQGSNGRPACWGATAQRVWTLTHSD